MWWPLWTSVAILVLIDTRTRAQKSQRTRSHDPYKSSCFGCLPAPGAACDDVTVLTCEGATPSCATTATTPSLTSQFICTADAPSTQPCSLTFTEKTQTYNITCSCKNKYCASHFTEHLVRNLTNFAAVNRVQNGQLIQEYLKFADLSNLPYDELIIKLMNRSQILKYSSEFHETTLSPEKVQSIYSNRTVSPEILNNKLGRENVIESLPIENLPKAEALNQEATVPSDDDEDDGEGSGASEEGRGQRRPAAAAPAAPSSFLPANTNAANKIFFTFTFFPFLIYILT